MTSSRPSRFPDRPHTTTLFRLLRCLKQLRHGRSKTTPDPRQLLANDPNNDGGATPDASTCATSDLLNDLVNGQRAIVSIAFDFASLVVEASKDIIKDADAGDSDAVANLVSIVNSYRCCNVLPDLDIVLLDSADSAHLQVEIEGVASGVPTVAAHTVICSTFDFFMF